MSLYNLVILAIIIAGVYFIGGRLHRVWEIREDMTQTLQQEQLLRDENTRLKAQYDKLNDPDEISREAREQFGLAKPDEIPYSRKSLSNLPFWELNFWAIMSIMTIYVYQLC